jgi:hypothetical protein
MVVGFFMMIHVKSLRYSQLTAKAGFEGHGSNMFSFIASYPFGQDS